MEERLININLSLNIGYGTSFAATDPNDLILYLFIAKRGEDVYWIGTWTGLGEQNVETLKFRIKALAIEFLNILSILVVGDLKKNSSLC